MAVLAVKKRLAVDSNFLFDLAADRDFAHTFREIAQERGYLLETPPTVVQELSYIAFQRKPANAQQRTESSLAHTALTKMLSQWNIMPRDLIPCGHGITEQFVKKLQKAGHLPEDEFNDGLILAETSLMGIPVLITSDRHLLDIDPTQLRVCFDSSDLTPVMVVKPGALLKAMS